MSLKSPLYAAHLAEYHVFDVVEHQSSESFIDFVDVTVEGEAFHVFPGIGQTKAADIIAETPLDLLGVGSGDGRTAACVGKEVPQQLAGRP